MNLRGIFNKKLLLNRLKRFCKYTRIPGFKYLVLSNRCLLERVYWSFVLISMTICGGILSYNVVMDTIHRTEIIEDANYYSVWNYLFPAVTICNLNKISKRKVYDLAAKLESNKTLDEVAENLRLLSSLLYFSYKSPNTEKNFEELKDLLDKNGLIAWKTFLDLAPSCSEFIVSCRWNGEYKACSIILENVVTPHGLCCSFNYFAPKYHGNYSRCRTTPRRISNCGLSTGLRVSLKTDVDDFYASTLPATGFTLNIHDPYHLIEAETGNTILLKDYSFNFVHLFPSRVKVSENVNRMDLSRRKCLIGEEKPSNISQHSGLKNCLSECNRNLILKVCKCIPFYLYVEAVHSKYKICGVEDISCCADNKFIFRKIDFYKAFSNLTKCDCMKRCEQTSFFTNIVLGDLYIKEQSNYNLTTTFTLAYRDILGSKSTMVSLGWSNFIAGLGGLLGLFMGLSFVTLFECFYFFTIDFVIYIFNLELNKRKMNEEKRNKLTTDGKTRAKY